MKKIAIAVIIIISIPITAYVLFSYHTSANLAFTEQITLTLYSGTFCRDQNIFIPQIDTVVVTDPNYVQDIVSVIQNGSRWDWLTYPSAACPFRLTMIFEGGGRRVYVFPATDDCPAIFIGGRLFIIDEASRIALWDNVRKHIDIGW